VCGGLWKVWRGAKPKGMVKGSSHTNGHPPMTHPNWLSRAQEWNPFAILNNRPPPALRGVPFRDRNRIGRMASRCQKAPDPATAALVRDYALWVRGRWTWKRTISAAVLLLPGALVTGDPVLIILAVICLTSGFVGQRLI
jgi:hypothetical protein